MERKTSTTESGTIKCTKCQGLVSGKLQYTGDNYCKCKPEIKSSTGWICPVCGAGLSPFTSYCPCKINNIDPKWIVNVDENNLIWPT